MIGFKGAVCSECLYMKDYDLSVEENPVICSGCEALEHFGDILKDKRYIARAIKMNHDQYFREKGIQEEIF